MHNKQKVPELSSFKWFFFVRVLARETMQILNRYNVFTSNNLSEKKIVWKENAKKCDKKITNVFMAPLTPKSVHMWLCCWWQENTLQQWWNWIFSMQCIANHWINEFMKYTINYQLTSKAKLLKIHHIKSETLSLIKKYRHLKLFKTDLMWIMHLNIEHSYIPGDSIKE